MTRYALHTPSRIDDLPNRGHRPESWDVFASITARRLIAAARPAKFDAETRDELSKAASGKDRVKREASNLESGPLARSPETAGEIMTTDVICVPVGASVREAAVLMLENRISALPVLAADERLVGMVSEGDLLGRGDADRIARRDWWLTLLKDGREVDGSMQAVIARPVEEVMRAPVITIQARAGLNEIAETLHVHDIKRLPVMHGDRLIGVVSRSDLVRAMARIPKPSSGGPMNGLLSLFAGMMQSDVRPEESPEAPPPVVAVVHPPTAESFRELVTVAEQTVRDDAIAAKQLALTNRHLRTEALLSRRLGDAGWSKLLDRAHDAAAHGENSFELIRFPCDLCSDGGRKIDVAESDWPTTLRGEAAEIFARWERELRPDGFRLSAEIAGYLDGMPSDVALSLAWAAPGSNDDNNKQ